MKKLIMILALVGALSLISIASAQFTSSQTWGSFGNGTGQFYGMSGVATDTSGNIYVAELDNRVQKFSGNSTYLRQFNIPARDITIDSSGNIYATVNDSIKKFDSTGTLLNTWGSTGTGSGYFNFPTGIALDSSRNIYVSDMENNRIQKLDSSGNYVTSWGTLGSGNGNLKSPAGIAVSGDDVYVADMGNYRIQKFDLNGNYVSSLGSQGTGNTQFNTSIAVANDSSGNVYVADYYNGRVIKYDSNFNYLTQHTGFSYPTALVIANSNLYVLDSGNYRVCEYHDYNSIRANFTSNVTSGYAPLSVQFNDSSENATSVSWDFGDGNNSTERNPIHEFITQGIYTVNLTAINENGTDSKLATITVSEKPVLPVANFTANVTSGFAPLSIQFNDSSENADTVSWDFENDGVIDSGGRNPSHTYHSPGTYTVSLNASNADGYNISTKPNLITVTTTNGQVTNGLVVYYDGNLSGNSLIDLSGNGNTGYATSVTQGTEPVTGAKYINFNGLNSKIDISNNAQTNVSSPVSIEFIGSINNFTQYGALVSKYNNGILGWYLSCSSDAPYNYARFGAGLSSGGLNSYESNISLVAKQVYDIVVTYDNNVTHIYVNGVDSADARTWNSPIAGLPNNVTIGYGSGLNYGNCSMYTVRLYNRSLSSAEVLQNYNNDLWRYTTRVTPTITWSNPAAINYGTALSGTQLNASASVPGIFVYNPVSGTILGAGNHTLQTTFIPVDSTNYTTASSSVSLTVNKATPLITWSNPADITYGTPLGETQLNASSSVTGSFVYTPSSGTVLNAGTHTLHVDFTPTDAVNYTNATADVIINVSEKPVLPVANFSTNVSEGFAPLSVQFNDSSENATSVIWDFGDGSNSTERNPVHDFATQGIYTVNLTAINVNGTDLKSATINVSETPEPVLPVANFSANVTSGFAPLSVQFNDSSENATSVIWDFGDGSNSTERNPVHDFATQGIYTVNLTAINVNGTDLKSATINVSEKPVLPVANFSTNVSEGFAPLSVQFNDSSENATSVIWDFGDGSNSTERNPVHDFATQGIYTVNLTAINVNGTDLKSATINVSEKPVLPVANFSTNVSEGFAPLSVQFNDSSENATSVIWDFGDGSNSDGKKSSS